MASGRAVSATTAGAAGTTTASPSQGRVGCGLGHDGGLADYVLLPDQRHFVAADGVPATVLAPLADAGLTAYHAIRSQRDALTGECTALVIGVGGLGHLAVQILRATTTARVVAVDPRPEARALAAELGAHRTGSTVEEAMAGRAPMWSWTSSAPTRPCAPGAPSSCRAGAWSSSAARAAGWSSARAWRFHSAGR